MSRRRLLEGTVDLVGFGDDACSRPAAPNADRWCAFVQTTLQNWRPLPELWAINISQAIAGVDIRCDATDKNCRLLNSDLGGEFSEYRFNGDTLVFFGNARRAPDFVKGAWAWRPGWSAPRLLTSVESPFCAASPTGAAAYCLQNLTTGGGVLRADLLAGNLPDAQAPALRKLDQIIVDVDGDPAAPKQWNVIFSPDGTTLAWSTRPAPDGKETLKVQNLNDDSSPSVVAEDVAGFQISRDGTRYYWLKQFKFSITGDDAGVLQVASFPEGANAATLMEDVAGFAEAGSKGLSVLSGFRGFAGDLKAIPDRDQPSLVTVLDAGVAKLWPPARDGIAVAYSKTFSDANAHDLYLRSIDAAEPCVLVAGPASVHQVTLSDRGTHVAWTQKDQTGVNFDGFLASTTTCHQNRFASAVFRFDPIGEGGFVWDQSDTGAGNLRAILYDRFDADEPPSEATGIDTATGAPFAILREQAAIVYTVRSDDARAGLYLRTGLPFSTVP